MDTLQSCTENVITVTLLVTLLTVLMSYPLLGEGLGRKTHPPGPLALPLIGNLHQIFLAGSLPKFCQKYSKIYGNIFTVETGGNKRVVVSGYEIFRELFIKHSAVTSTRNIQSRDKAFQERFKTAPGLLYAQHPHWKIMRTFTLNSLRGDGMGRAVLEPQILEEIKSYLDYFIKPNENKPLDMTSSLPMASCNIVSQLIFGHRFDFDDSTFARSVDGINNYTRLITRSALAESVLFGKHIFKSQLEGYQLQQADVERGISQFIDEQKKTMDPEEPRCLLDQILIHAHTSAGLTDSYFGDENTRAVIKHLYVAGTETVATTLRFCLLFMCKHPDIQEQVHQEIDEHVGKRDVTFKDRLSLQLTDAVIMETLRTANISPLGVSRRLDEQLVVDGMLIPAGTDLIMNMASVLHDETVFEEPLKFKPQRYLEGDRELKKQRTISFGIGRRSCIAESLARVELFLFFVVFMQRYKVELPRGSIADPSDVSEDIIRSPKPYHIIFRPR